MAMDKSNPKVLASPSDQLLVGALVGSAVATGVLWVGGQAASLVSGNGWATGTLLAGVNSVISHRTDPGQAWESAMPGPEIYWTVSVLTLLLILGVTAGVTLLVRRRGRDRRRVTRMGTRPGMASTADITRTVGARTLLAKSAELRPALTGRRVRPTRARVVLGQGPRRERVHQRPGLRRPPRPVRRRERRLRGDQPGPRRPRRRRRHLHPPRRRRRHHDRPQSCGPGRGDRDRRVRRRPPRNRAVVTDHRVPRRTHRRRPGARPGRRILHRGGGRLVLAGLVRESHQSAPARRGLG